MHQKSIFVDINAINLSLGNVKMNLEQIPNEILVKILSYVSQSRRMAELQLQSKHFQRVVTEHYFEHITGITITPHSTEGEDEVSMQISCSLFTETIECDLKTLASRFEYFWKRSPNISQLTLEGKSNPNLTKTLPNPLVPQRRAYNTTLLAIMRAIIDQRTCEKYPRKISQFDCIPCITLPPICLVRHISFFDHYKTMISNWTSTLKTTAMCVAPEIQEAWMKLMRHTAVENLNLYFPAVLPATHPPLSVAAPSDSSANIFERLEHLLHQPNRVIRQLNIHMPESTTTSHTARMFHALLTKLNPVNELSLEIPLSLRFKWHAFLTQQPEPFPLTPFREKLEILHAGPRFGFMCEDFTNWPIWNIFPNLRQVTGIHLTNTFLDNIARPFNRVLGCKPFKNKELTLNFRPIQQNCIVISRFLEKHHNYQQNIPSGFQFTWKPQEGSSCQTLHITISCVSCQPSSKHRFFLIIPTCAKGQTTPSHLFELLL
jgi:hypothetical protein